MKNEKEIHELAQELKSASYKYYNEGTSELSDEEWDFKRKRLKELDPNNVFLKEIGAPVHGELVLHNSVMLSLDDFWKYEDLPVLIKQDIDSNSRDLIPELKYDGIAVSVVYRDGKLLYVATRGDGYQGEVITKSAMHVKGIPTVLKQSINGLIEVRGEIIFPKEAFNKVSSELKYANPRNAVAGLLRRLDTDFLKDKGLVFIPYDVPKSPYDDCTLYSSLLAKIFDLGIGTEVHDDIKNSLTWFRDLQNKYMNFNMAFEDFVSVVISNREILPFEIDGLVFKFNNLNTRKSLGITGRTPRWGIAFKFPGSVGITVLEKVDWQVSRNGKLTPVGKVTPVHIGGVVYTSVTLHNVDEISRLSLSIGDKVLIERRGDVIPKVMKVIEKSSSGTPITVPVTCPSCNCLIKDLSSEPRCENDVDCLDQIYLKVVHFASRKAMNIEGLAESTAKMLVSNNLVTSVSDLYQLTIDSINSLERFGKQSSINLFNNIQNSKNKELSKLIYGLGIKDVGESTSHAFASLIESLDVWLSYRDQKDEFFNLLSGIPLSVIELSARLSLYEYITNPVNVNTLKSLIDNGVNQIFKNNKLSNKLENKTFVITGSFSGYSRDDITKTIISNGGKVSTSVSANTNFLIAGQNEGSKLAVAIKLNTPIIRLTNSPTINDVETLLLTVCANEENN